jgi:DNA-binding LytR/AlgR family response regulator
METEQIMKIKGKGNDLISVLIRKDNERINYFESDGILTYIVFADGSRLKVDLFLHQLEGILPSKLFYRCGWSFIVNLSKIQEYWVLGYPFLVMENGEVIPVPQSEKETIKSLISNKMIIREG